MGVIFKKHKKPLLKFTLYLQSNPQNDVDVLKSEISFKNPELIQVKANWKEDGATELLQGLKEQVPRIGDAVYNCVNKYHHMHTGMEISTATLKLKDSLRTNADLAYRGSLNRINEFEEQLHQVVTQASGKYSAMREKAKKMYYEAADRASQAEYNELRDQFFDVIMNVTVAYQKAVKRLIDSAIEFLKITKFQVPGLAEKHTGEELYIMATEKLAQAVDLCFSKLKDYSDALLAFINELEVKIPASTQIIRGRQVLDEIKGFLSHIQKKASQIFVSLKEIDLAEKLRELKELAQQVFQKAEQIIQNLKAQNYEYIKDQTKQLITKILQGLNTLAEDIKHLVPRAENIIRNDLQSVFMKLEEFVLYMKDLREKYFDSTMDGWSVKYYEMEQKVLTWLRSLLNDLVEWHAQYIQSTADQISHLTNQLKEFVESDGEITALSKSVHDKIVYWSEAAKRSAAEQNEWIKAKLQEAYEQLSNSYERLIAMTQKLIDLTIENYSAFLQYLQQFLERLERATADSLRPYVMVRQGELRIDIPKPFDLLSVYQMPQSSEESFRKK